MISPMGGFASTPQQDPLLAGHRLNIFVHDQERSLRFHLDRLGFRWVSIPGCSLGSAELPSRLQTAARSAH
jgi:hypothetical protein